MPHCFQDKISSFIRLRLFRIRFSRQRLWLLAKHLETTRSISDLWFQLEHTDLKSASSRVSALEDASCYASCVVPFRMTADLHNSRNEPLSYIKLVCGYVRCDIVAIFD
jgi:hypothetical protein